MKLFDEDSIGWALVAVTLFFVVAQVIRAVANGLYQSESEAQLHSKRISGAIERRDGEDTRCLHFCQVRSFCNYGRTLK
jgi:hypothetical protein